MVAGLHELEGLLFGLEDANVLSLRAALQGIGMSDEVASLLVELQIAINENRLIDEVQRTSESTTPTGLEEFLSSTLTR